MNNILIFFTVVLLTKDNVISDSIINYPRFLSYQTHTSIDCYFRLILIDWELHFSQQRIHQRRLARAYISNNSHHLTFLYSKVQISKMVCIIGNYSLYLFSALIPIEVSIFYNNRIFVFTYLISAMVDTRKIYLFGQKIILNSLYCVC